MATRLSIDKQRRIANAKNNILDELMERGFVDEDDADVIESLDDFITHELYKLFA